MKPTSKLASALSSGLLAETLAILSPIFGIVALKIHPVFSCFGVVLAILALIPLIVFGRERYCITGLAILMLASMGLLTSMTAIVVYLMAHIRS
jgi:hypothetical protein